MFVPLLFAVLIMLIIITFLLATEYLPNADNSNSQAYTIALILICTVSAIVIVILMVNTLKDACLT